MELIIQPDIDACGYWNVVLLIPSAWSKKGVKRRVVLPDSYGVTVHHSRSDAERVGVWYSDALKIPMKVNTRRRSRRWNPCQST